MLLFLHILSSLDLLLGAEVGTHHVDAGLVQGGLGQALEVLMPAIKPLLRPHPYRLLDQGSTGLILAAIVLRLICRCLTVHSRLLLHLRRRPTRVVSGGMLLAGVLLLLVLQEEVAILGFDVTSSGSLLYALFGYYLIGCLS